LEYNAHFQQTLASLFSAMASLLASREHYGDARMELPWLGSFQRFVAKFFETADRQKYQLRQYLSEANRRKMIRRLYKLYGVIKQQWPNVPEIQAQAQAYVMRWRADDLKYAQATSSSDADDTAASTMPADVLA
jgi:hypothetical protein